MLRAASGLTRRNTAVQALRMAVSLEIFVCNRIITQEQD